MTRAKGSRRAAVAGIVLAAGALGMFALVRREFFRPRLDRLSEAALRVAPGATYYAVYQGDQQVGYASSTVDTTRTAILVRDYLVADVTAGGKTHRASSRSAVTLSRGLRVRDFTVELQGERGPSEVGGRVDGDSVVVLGIRAGRAPADSQRLQIDGPVLLPTLLPLAIALGEQPEVGKDYTLPVFDPGERTTRQVALSVDAESLFVIPDSATFDSTAKRWVGILPDTVRAWHVRSGDAAGFTGWVDALGRVVEGVQLGSFTIRRMPHEVAFENWRMKAVEQPTAVTADRDLVERTLIASNVSPGRPLTKLAVRLGGVDLRGLDLDGGRQRLRGDTLFIEREQAPRLLGTFRLNGAGRIRMPRETTAEPLVEADDPEIQALATRIQRSATGRPEIVTYNADEYARALVKWVHDSLEKRVSAGIPSARQVLRTRSGDCNEHTQLYVALARARGLPARAATGLVYTGGKFYYHAWPEVYLSGWVAVDPTFGQFPADASHLRFVVGGLDRQAELLRLLGTLSLDVLQTTP